MKTKAVIYDMDGTLTRPYIEWSRLRRDMGVPEGQFILAYLESLPPGKREDTEEILLTHERKAALNSELNPGVAAAVHRIKGAGLPQAIATNNSPASAAEVLRRHGLEFDHVLTRADGPPKPCGDLLLLAAQRVGHDPEDIVYVGDGEFDLRAAEEAGMPFILIRSHDRAPVWEPCIHSFAELPALLEIDT